MIKLSITSLTLPPSLPPPSFRRRRVDDLPNRPTGLPLLDPPLEYRLTSRSRERALTRDRVLDALINTIAPTADLGPRKVRRGLEAAVDVVRVVSAVGRERIVLVAGDVVVVWSEVVERGGRKSRGGEGEEGDGLGTLT
jgi:hypothetical protein